LAAGHDAGREGGGFVVGEGVREGDAEVAFGEGVFGETAWGVE
jgi:hypothetical protein